jgi:UDP-glucuronate decarboxylase
MKMFLDSDINEVLFNTKDSLKKLSGKTVLITGAAGFLGRYFMEVFLKYNRDSGLTPINIIALDSYISSGKTEFENIVHKIDNVEWIYGDASIAAQLPNKFHFIIHAAGIASPEHYRANPLKTIDVAVNVTRQLLERAQMDSARMIFFSSSEIYGDPDSKSIPTNEDYRGFVNIRGPRACYDESKRLGETLCWIYQTYFDVHVTVVRPFNVYGPGMLPKDFRVLPNFAASIARNENLKVYGTGMQTRTFCYVSDAISGFLKVLIDSPKADVFNIGNPTPEISITDLALMVLNIVNSNLKLELINYPESYPSDEPNRRCPDITKAKKILNFYPTVDLEEGLKRFLSWSSKNYTDEIL